MPDHDRPLAPRGEQALVRLRRYMAGRDLSPALVLCSSARRTVLTCNGILPALPADTTVEIEQTSTAPPARGSWPGCGAWATTFPACW